VKQKAQQWKLEAVIFVVPMSWFFEKRGGRGLGEEKPTLPSF